MFSEPEFWVLVAFVVFVAAVGGKAYKAITQRLDERAAKIKGELDEAVRLREEAQALLASYQRKQRDAAAEAEAIVARAGAEAERLAAEAEADLKATLDRRAELALARIGQAEGQAANDVRDLVIEVASNAARRLLVESLDQGRADQLVDKAIAEAADKLH
jgi:F-type H+-transporting ATPase subunit b